MSDTLMIYKINAHHSFEVVANRDGWNLHSDFAGNGL